MILLGPVWGCPFIVIQTAKFIIEIIAEVVCYNIHDNK